MDKKQIKNMVQYEMETDLFTRNDDNYLISKVYQDFFGLGAVVPFAYVMENHALLGLPSFETITRWRRRLQEKYPLVYGANGEVRKIRREEESLFKGIFANE